MKNKNKFCWICKREEDKNNDYFLSKIKGIDYSITKDNSHLCDLDDLYEQKLNRDHILDTKLKNKIYVCVICQAILFTKIEEWFSLYLDEDSVNEKYKQLIKRIIGEKNANK